MDTSGQIILLMSGPGLNLWPRTKERGITRRASVMQVANMVGDTVRRAGFSRADAAAATSGVLFQAGRDHYEAKSASIPKRYRGTYSKNKMVYVDGVSSGKTLVKASKKRRRKKKTSLKKKVNKLVRAMPKTSQKTFRDFKFLCFNGTKNQKRVYEHVVYDRNYINTRIATLRQSDSNNIADTITYNSRGKALKYSMFTEYCFKNNAKGNVTLSYCFVKAKDDGYKDFGECLQQDLISRGYASALLPPLTAKVLAGTNTSEQPQQWRYGANGISAGNNAHFHVPLQGGTYTASEWDKVGQIKTVTLGPGDIIKAYWKTKNRTYDPEIGIVENKNKLTGDVRLIVWAHGGIGHDGDGAKFCLIGYGDYQLDCLEKRILNVKYANPGGWDDISLTEDITSATPPDYSNSAIIHADNHLSALEGGQKV